MGSILNDNRVRVLLGLLVGLAFIIYKNPPHTVCTSQIDDYRASVFKMAKEYKVTLDNCTGHPDAGGCLAFFEMLNKYESRFGEITHQCQPEVAGDSRLYRWIEMGMEMFVRLAWGYQPPATSGLRNGWLEANQVAQFCRLRRHLEVIEGKDAWAQFVRDIIPTLPGEKDVENHFGYNEVWARTVMSDSCAYKF